MGQNKFVVKIKYSKGEEIKYISHLDLIRSLERTIRRACLPVAYSQGFNPRMLISYKTKALKVGESSDCCEADITFEKFIKPGDVMARINKEAPCGFTILSSEIG